MPVRPVHKNGGLDLSTEAGALGERMRRACVLVGLVVMPAVAEAQVVFSLEQLARRVRPGDRVAVTLRVETEAGRLPCRQGGELQGRIRGCRPRRCPCGPSSRGWNWTNGKCASFVDAIGIRAGTAR